MSGRIFISHSNTDVQLAGGVAHFLEAAITGASVQGSSLPGRVPEGGDDSLAALKQQLVSADAVIGLITPEALASGEVPFQLGAAWALGQRLVLLLGQEGRSAELYLPMGHAEALVLGPEALLELAAALAASLGLRADVGEAARGALTALFPDYAGFERASSERVVSTPAPSGDTQPIWPLDANGEPRDPRAVSEAAAAPEPRAADDGVPRQSARVLRGGLPSCAQSLHAGRAVADCMFHRTEGDSFATELDLPFGAFLTALGPSWSALRELDDLDVWAEAAKNVLAQLEPDAQHVRAFYDIGYQLSTLINLANAALERDATQDPQLTSAWHDAWQSLRDAAVAARVGDAALGELEALVEGLFAPAGRRDFANLGRVQERMRELATEADLAVLAASA